MANQKAYTAVVKAVKNGDLPHISTKMCADCGNPAQHYDHRDYDKPLEVEPVCAKCNYSRGRALGTHDESPEGMSKTCVWVPKECTSSLQAYAKGLRDVYKREKAKK